MTVAGAVMLALAGSGGIYPAGHFDRVTKLTTANAEESIKGAVSAGKTLFVRWIASEG